MVYTAAMYTFWTLFAISIIIIVIAVLKGNDNNMAIIGSCFFVIVIILAVFSEFIPMYKCPECEHKYESQKIDGVSINYCVECGKKFKEGDSDNKYQYKYRFKCGKELTDENSVCSSCGK